MSFFCSSGTSVLRHVRFLLGADLRFDARWDDVELAAKAAKPVLERSARETFPPWALRCEIENDLFSPVAYILFSELRA